MPVDCSAISNQQSAISNQQSAISNQQSAFRASQVIGQMLGSNSDVSYRAALAHRLARSDALPAPRLDDSAVPACRHAG
ncbi:MAG TPA: hypothetical protein DD803_16960 [Alcaligenes faecalis]|nr:hypothetical protein [Alcaligenes faecalis]